MTGSRRFSRVVLLSGGSPCGWSSPGFVLFAAPASAEFDFDKKHERGDHLFNPANRYEPDNLLNPTQPYVPDQPFRPAPHINNPDHPLSSSNRFHERMNAVWTSCLGKGRLGRLPRQPLSAGYMPRFRRSSHAATASLGGAPVSRVGAASPSVLPASRTWPPSRFGCPDTICESWCGCDRRSCRIPGDSAGQRPWYSRSQGIVAGGLRP